MYLFQVHWFPECSISSCVWPTFISLHLGILKYNFCFNDVTHFVSYNLLLLVITFLSFFCIRNFLQQKSLYFFSTFLIKIVDAIEGIAKTLGNTLKIPTLNTECPSPSFQIFQFLISLYVWWLCSSLLWLPSASTNLHVLIGRLVRYECYFLVKISDGTVLVTLCSGIPKQSFLFYSSPSKNSIFYLFLMYCLS